MLISNEIAERYRYRYVLCIDPGTTTMGAAIMRIDLVELNFHFIYTTTLLPAKLVKIRNDLSYVSDSQGNTSARLLAITIMLKDIMKGFNVMDVVAEDAYSAINVSTYATLIECHNAIRRAALETSVEIKVDLVKSSSMKKAIGVPGNSSDKTLMRKAISDKLLPFLDESIVLDELSEHECDAIGIGHYYFKQLVSTGVISKHIRYSEAHHGEETTS